MMTPELLHYTAAALGTSLGALGAGIGLGIAASGTEDAMVRQTMGNLQCFRTMIIGLAFIESGAIIALVTTLLTLFGVQQTMTWELANAELGMNLAVGVAAAAISIASSLVVRSASKALSRQPLFAQKILTFMLISQSIIEAPAIFAFIIALIIRGQLIPSLDYFSSLKLFAAGLTMALGCIGPSIGQAIFAHAACTSIGINKDAFKKLFPFALFNQAIIETPMIFCVLFAILITLSSFTPAMAPIAAIKDLVAAFTIGFGAIGSAIGIGYVGSYGCYQIALDPNTYGAIARSTLLTVAFIESAMIYALIIGLFLIR